MGIRFDTWQKGVGTLALGKRSDGRYAASVGGVVMSIPRQVGKTFLVGAIMIALCILNPGLTVVWTAHRTRTSTKTFQSLASISRRKLVAPHVLSRRTTNGEQEIRFRNGAVIMFGAREQGFGRGFDAVDVLVFDEAQILTEKALDDMVPAANQARHPAGALLFFMGTPPRPIDPGEEFTNRRQKAYSGNAPGMVYVELSADDDADPDDLDQVAKANPSFPDRTPLESILRMREQLTSDDSFRREALGIWEQRVAEGVLPYQLWLDNASPTSQPEERFAVGLECGPDLAHASVALAGQVGEHWHVELVDDQHTKGRGCAWLTPYVDDLVRMNPQIRAVVADVAGPIKALLTEKTLARGTRWYLGKVQVTPLRVEDVGTSCARVYDGVARGWLRHIGQPQLDAAVKVAGKRPLGDTGMWVYSRKTASADITPVQAMTWALYGAQSDRIRRPGRARTGERRAVLL